MPQTIVGWTPLPRAWPCVVGLLAALFSGCAVSRWQPEPLRRADEFAGARVRVLCPAGDVELKVARYADPLLEGSCLRSSNSHVECTPYTRVDLRDCVRVDRIPHPSTESAASMLGRTVYGLGAAVGIVFFLLLAAP
jgi:hypothetical protein